MKKTMIAVVIILIIFLALGAKRKSPNQQKEKLDTLLFVGSRGDSMYFVVNENNDTVDWFMYWNKEKLDKNALDYLYHLPDSFKK